MSKTKKLQLFAIVAQSLSLCVCQATLGRALSGLLVMFAATPYALGVTIDQLVAKQRQVMAQEIDKKLNALSLSSAQAKTSPCPLQTTHVKPEAHTSTLADDLHVHAVYGINGNITVDVSIGDGPSFPLTPGRIIQGWSIISISTSAVTFRYRKSARTKTIYLARPITHARVARVGCQEGCKV